LKQLALIFIAIFALNILGEVEAGHCDELDHQSQVEAGHRHSDSQNSKDSHSGCAHLCHFGHCGHVTLQSPMKLPIFAKPAAVWKSLVQIPYWRDLSPLLRPPIA
jgi:hypothetical protein